MSRSRRKGVNPNRIPVTQADVDKARSKGTKDAISFAWIVMFSVLMDKHGFTKEDLHRLWQEVDSLSQEIIEKRVSLPDLRRVLEEEYDIKIS